MRIAAIAATILILGAGSVSAGEWMGSLQFTNGANATWRANLKDGSGAGTVKTNGAKTSIYVVKTGNKVVVRDSKGGSVIGSGKTSHGKVTGEFRNGGSFSGKKK